MTTDPVRGARGETSEPSPEVELSVVSLLELAFEHRRVLVALPLLLALILAVAPLVRAPEFNARSRFITQESSTPASGLSGLGALWMNLSGSGEPLSFYPELIYSMDVLKRAAAEEYRIVDSSGDTTAVALTTLYEVGEGDPDDRIRAAADALESDIDVQINTPARMVVLTTTAVRPELAVQLNEKLLELVHSWNQERRQSQARSERQFLETRLEETSAALRHAETDMQRFLEQNRRYTQSPELTFEAGRLQRRIDVLQQRYISIVQGYDQARAEEVRSTPLITVVDEPADSVERVSTSPVLRILFGLIAGFLLAVVVVLVRAYTQYEKRRQPEAYARLRNRVLSAWPPTWGRLRRERGT